MNEKFTPGPWVNGRYDMGYIFDANGEYICVCGIDDSDGANANAALIAAAPDMYQALEWAYRVHGDHGGPLGLGAAMAAALKKAKGE